MSRAGLGGGGVLGRGRGSDSRTPQRLGEAPPVRRGPPAWGKQLGFRDPGGQSAPGARSVEWPAPLHGIPDRHPRLQPRGAHRGLQRCHLRLRADHAPQYVTPPSRPRHRPRGLYPLVLQLASSTSSYLQGLALLTAPPVPITPELPGPSEFSPLCLKVKLRGNTGAGLPGALSRRRSRWHPREGGLGSSQQKQRPPALAGAPGPQRPHPQV